MNFTIGSAEKINFWLCWSPLLLPRHVLLWNTVIIVENRWLVVPQSSCLLQLILLLLVMLMHSDAKIIIIDIDWKAFLSLDQVLWHEFTQVSRLLQRITLSNFVKLTGYFGQASSRTFISLLTSNLKRVLWLFSLIRVVFLPVVLLS